MASADRSVIRQPVLSSKAFCIRPDLFPPAAQTPARRGQIKRHGRRNFVGMADCLGPTVVRFDHRVDRQRDAMGEQCVPAVRVEAAKGIPEFARLLRQMLGLIPMASINTRRQRCIGEARRLGAEHHTLWLDF
jgi:hypothetical protein